MFRSRKHCYNAYETASSKRQIEYPSKLCKDVYGKLRERRTAFFSAVFAEYNVNGKKHDGKYRYVYGVSEKYLSFLAAQKTDSDAAADNYRCVAYIIVNFLHSLLYFRSARFMPVNPLKRAGQRYFRFIVLFSNAILVSGKKSPRGIAVGAFRIYLKFFTTTFSRIDTKPYIMPAKAHSTMVQVITKSSLKT